MAEQSVITKWNINKVVELYKANIRDDIFERVHRAIFDENPPADNDVNKFINRDYRHAPWIFRCGKAWWVPTLDKTVCLRMTNIPAPYVNHIIIENRDELLVDIIKEMCVEKPTYFYNLIIRPLIDVCTREQIFEIYHNCSYRHSNFKYDIANALPKEVQLVSHDGHIEMMHAYVAANSGEYLRTRILSPSWNYAIAYELTQSQQIPLPCSGATLKWFVEGAYAGVFNFTADIDKLDAVDTLDFLLIVKKEVIYEKCIQSLARDN